MIPKTELERTQVNIDEFFEKCISFLNEIGIETRFEKLDGHCFLPGLSIDNGAIIIDRERLENPGDLLHEAGHIAVVPSAERSMLSAPAIEKRTFRDAEEMMVLAWSYAACMHLDIDPYLVFHDNGYDGGGGYLADSFIDKKYIGLPMLQWKGMAVDAKKAAELQVKPYPFMLKWMHD